MQQIGQRSKYANKKVEYAGHTFDSKVELNYYLLLLAGQQKGEIESIKLQPKYILQDSFVKRGKRFQKITYIADFEVKYADGHIEVVDVKGMETPVFALKLKMFEARYPNMTLKVLKYVKKFGGWVLMEEYKRLKRMRHKKPCSRYLDWPST